MIYKSFRINCIYRILLLCSTFCLFFYIIFQTSYYVTCMIIAFLIIFQIASLLRFIDKSNQLLSRAFDSVLSEDFSERLDNDQGDSSFKEVFDSLNIIIAKFQKNRIEKEQQFKYLQAVVDQTGMGLFSVNSDGKINMINKSARNMFGLVDLTHLDQLQSKHKSLLEILRQMKSGEKRYIDMVKRDSQMHVVVYAKEIRLQGEQNRIFTLQNIQTELEAKEMDAWKNLIRVLNHEIMNSVTPISSLAATANKLIGSNSEINSSDTEDLRQAMQTIEKRSQGLMQFVQNYRRFARIPEPVKKIVPVSPLFNRIEKLIMPRLENGDIQFRMSIDPNSLHLNVDPNLIEQVLLNLLSNAIEAVEEIEYPKIELMAEMNERPAVVIQIRDNGRGISEDVLTKIFIPFFTTRSEGTGIGLSLSRQIMRLHGGSIRVKSEPDVQTVFSLLF